jgi:hypothetical protein
VPTQARNLLARPFGAPTLGGFWRYWNPVYGYVLLFHVYRPLRRRLPAPLAAWLTFVLCGFLLHDAVGWLLAGRVRAPEMTFMFALWGAEVVAADALGFDLTGTPYLVRAAANITHLVLGWAVAAYLLVPAVS